MNKGDSFFREINPCARRMLWIGLACLGGLLLGACGGDDYNPGNNYTDGGGGGGTVTIEPLLSDIQANVFTPTCASCHPSNGDLNLSSTGNVLATVDVLDDHVPGHTIIVSGDPDASYLIWKLEGVDNLGNSVARMPASGEYLSQSTIDVIRQWIFDGALNN